MTLTIQHEKPDLEEQKTKLLQQEEDKKIQLAKLEESLLEVKFSYSGCWSYYIFQLKSNAVFLKVIIPSACFWLYQKNINIYIKIKIQIENG